MLKPTSTTELWIPKWFELFGDKGYIETFDYLEIWWPIKSSPDDLMGYDLMPCFKDKDWEQVYIYEGRECYHYIRADRSYSQFFPRPCKKWKKESKIKDEGDFFRLYYKIRWDEQYPIYIDKKNWKVYKENNATAWLIQKVKRLFLGIMD